MLDRIKADTSRLQSASGRLAGRADRFQQRHTWLALPVAVARKTADDQGGSLAALISYYGFLGAFPLLLVFAAILGLVLAGHPGLQNSVLNSVESSFPALSGYINPTLSASRAALGVGLAGAAWAGLGVTRATERAMDTIWDIPMSDRPSLWWGRMRGLLMLVILGATFLASDALAAIRGGGGVLGLAGDVTAVAGTLVLNLVLYGLAFQVLTNRRLRWRTVLPGAAVGAAGWTILLNLGSYFVRHEVAHATRLYGTIGFVIGLTAWIYLGARLTIYAAEVNVVLEYRLWPRGLSGSAGTDADRRALLRQVREAQRSAGETIQVTWSKMTAAGGDPPAGTAEQPAGTAEQPAGTAEQPAATGEQPAGVPAAVAHLQLLEDLRRQRDSGRGARDPARREELARARRAAAATALKALRDAASHDPDLAAALEASHTGDDPTGVTRPTGPAGITGGTPAGESPAISPP